MLIVFKSKTRTIRIHRYCGNEVKLKLFSLKWYTCDHCQHLVHKIATNVRVDYYREVLNMKSCGEGDIIEGLTNEYIEDYYI